MGLENVDRETLVNLYWEKSVNALKSVDELINIHDWSTAANRLYYCAFYALSAMFVNDGNPVNSHRGAKSVLYLHYIKPNLLERNISTLFSQLQTLRDKADYDVIFTASEKEIMDFRMEIDAFLKVIGDRIKK